MATTTTAPPSLSSKNVELKEQPQSQPTQPKVGQAEGLQSLHPSIFHEGEQDMQRKAGTFMFAKNLGEHKIKPYIAPEFREFVETRHAVYLASMDPDTGAVWASVVYADPTPEIPIEDGGGISEIRYESPSMIAMPASTDLDEFTPVSSVPVMRTFAPPGVPFCKPLDTCSVAVATSTMTSLYQSSAYVQLVHLLSPSEVYVNKPPLEGDPFWKNAKSGSQVSLSFLEFETRRRYRVNGIIKDGVTRGGFTVTVQEAFSICPKYIQRRTIEAVHPISQPKITFSDPSDPSLPPELVEFIVSSDTFMIATMTAGKGGDASHRGGRPGFVRVADNRTLLWGDYVGKGMFQTLGNTLLHPNTGLLFMDFEKGPILQLTGELKVEWLEPGQSLDGSDRLVIFKVSSWRYHSAACPFRWKFLDMSSHHPMLEDKPCMNKWVKQSLVSGIGKYKARAEEPVKQLVINSKRVESSNVTTIRFKLPIRLDHQPGQYATFTFDIGGRKFMRSYTISSANLMQLAGTKQESPSPEVNSSEFFEISARYTPSGVVSKWLHDQAQIGDSSILFMGAEGSFTLESSYRIQKKNHFVSEHATPDRPFRTWWKVLYLTAGIGLTPMISMMRGLHHTKMEGYLDEEELPDVIWLHSERTFKSFAFPSEIAQFHSGLCDKFLLAITEHHEGREEKAHEKLCLELFPMEDIIRGHVDLSTLERVVPDMKDRVAYLCGPNTFMGAMVEYITHLGISPKHILTESFDY